VRGSVLPGRAGRRSCHSQGQLAEVGAGTCPCEAATARANSPRRTRRNVTGTADRATSPQTQPALVYYVPDPCAPIWRAVALLVPGLRGERVCALTRFGDHGLLARFGLPRTLPRD
jgi:hypothetical protein